MDLSNRVESSFSNRREFVEGRSTRNENQDNVDDTNHPLQSTERYGNHTSTPSEYSSPPYDQSWTTQTLPNYPHKPRYDPTVAVHQPYNPYSNRYVPLAPSHSHSFAYPTFHKPYLPTSLIPFDGTFQPPAYQTLPNTYQQIPRPNRDPYASYDISSAGVDKVDQEPPQPDPGVQPNPGSAKNRLPQPPYQFVQVPNQRRTATACTVAFTGTVILACIVFWFFGMLFGGVAYALAVSGIKSAARGDLSKARSKRCSSICCSVFGIVIGGVCTAVAIVKLVNMESNSATYYSSSYTYYRG